MKKNIALILSMLSLSTPVVAGVYGHISVYSANALVRLYCAAHFVAPNDDKNELQLVLAVNSVPGFDENNITELFPLANLYGCNLYAGDNYSILIGNFLFTGLPAQEIMFVNSARGLNNTDYFPIFGGQSEVKLITTYGK